MSTNKDMRDLELMEDLLGRKYEVCGIELRMPSMSAFGVLRAGGCRLVTGLDITGDLANAPEMELLKAIALLDAKRTSREAYRLATKPEELLDEALELGERFQYTQMPEVMAGVTQYLVDATKMRVELLPDEGKELEPPKE